MAPSTATLARAAAVLAALALVFLSPATTRADILLNELQADNENTIADDHDEYDDWFELVNTGAQAVDLTGYQLSDDDDLAETHVLPGPLSIAAGGRLLLWADGQVDQGPAHLPFRLSSSGETVTLLAPDGVTVIDQIEFPRQFPDHVFQRYPDAGSTWTWGRDPSPLAPNTAPRHGGFLVLNELMPKNQTVIQDDAGDYDDWLEIHNPLPIDVSLAGMTLHVAGGTTAPLPSLALAPQAYRLVWCDGDAGQGAWHLPELLMAAGGGLELRADDGVAASEVIYPALDTDHAQARMPDGGPWQTTVMVTPGQTNPATSDPLLVINEFLASNDTGIVDEAGDHEDWLELYNPGDAPVALAGLFLTDDLAVPDAWALPAIDLAPGEHLVVWCDDDEEEGPLHASFKISANGEELGLFLGDELIDSIVFGAQTTDVSTGRRVDAGLPWISFDEPSPGEPNQGAVAAPAPTPASVLLAPRPNPFNPRVELAWRQAEAGWTRLDVFDLRGRLVARLADRWFAPGDHVLTWDGRDRRGRAAPSGVYTVQLRQGATRASARLTLAR